MTTLPTKHQRLAALRPLSPESVASLAAAWDVRMARNPDQFPEVRKLIGTRNKPQRSSSPVSGQNARATWRGHSARRQIIRAGYPPISIPTGLRQAYYNALEAADSGDFQTWFNFLTHQLDQELDQWLSALEDGRQKT